MTATSDQLDLTAALDGTGLVVLHGRRQPDQDIRVDHLVVGAAAVFVVVEKVYTGGKIHTGNNSPWIGFHSETPLLRTVKDAGKRVRKVLKGAGVRRQVIPVLCFTGVGVPAFPNFDWIFGDDSNILMRVALAPGAINVFIGNRDTLMRMVLKPGAIAVEEAKRIGYVLAEGFPLA